MTQLTDVELLEAARHGQSLSQELSQSEAGRIILGNHDFICQFCALDDRCQRAVVRVAQAVNSDPNGLKTIPYALNQRAMGAAQIQPAPEGSDARRRRYEVQAGRSARNVSWVFDRPSTHWSCTCNQPMCYHRVLVAMYVA